MVATKRRIENPDTSNLEARDKAKIFMPYLNLAQQILKLDNFCMVLITMWMLDLPLGACGRIFPFKDVLNKIATSCNRARIWNLCPSHRKNNKVPKNLASLPTVQPRP